MLGRVRLKSCGKWGSCFDFGHWGATYLTLSPQGKLVLQSNSVTPSPTLQHKFSRDVICLCFVIVGDLHLGMILSWKAKKQHANSFVVHTAEAAIQNWWLNQPMNEKYQNWNLRRQKRDTKIQNMSETNTWPVKGVLFVSLSKNLLFTN